jgi:sulfate permease, SulP family
LAFIQKSEHLMALMTKPGDLPSAAIPLDFELADTPEVAQGLHLWKQKLFGALDGAAVSIPIALGGVALVYANFPAQYLSYGVLATLLALLVLHAVSALGTRPIVFSARLVEAGTLAAVLNQFATYMPAWGLDTRPQVLLALMCVLGVVAYIVCMVLFLLRADRFTRLIPTPVYSGFTISIAILLLVSQSKVLWQLWQTGHSAVALGSICAAALAASLAVQRFAPRWPATALGVFAGTVVGMLWWTAGSSVSMVMVPGQSMQLPWAEADFSALLVPSVKTANLVPSLLSNGVLLGLVMFINMTVANETLSQLDDCYASRWQHAGVALSGALGSAVGAVPMGPSQQAALATLRSTPLAGHTIFFVGLICAAVGLSGSLNWIPVAAVAVAMVFNGLYLIDRGVVRQAWQWLRGAQLPGSQKEDLALVAAVILATVVFNVVVAVFIGLLFGLLLFALRNAKQPVRYQWTGEQLHSNCARGRYELGLLAQHGSKIKVLELDGELFFGAVSSLDHSLAKSLELAQTVILDWSRVRHVDSSIAMALQRWQRVAKAAGVRTLHAGAALQKGNAAAFLAQHLPTANLQPDVDRALEVAENSVIDLWGIENSEQTTTLHVVLPIFNGMTAKERDQALQCMPQRLYKSGEVVFRAGDTSDCMLVVLQGSAGVIVRNAQRDIRLTSVRRGGVIGEVGFLDGAPRSATVVAQEGLLVYVLTRPAFDNLRKTSPDAVHQMMLNITLDLASRLRHTNKLATARSELA